MCGSSRPTTRSGLLALISDLTGQAAPCGDSYLPLPISKLTSSANAALVETYDVRSAVVHIECAALDRNRTPTPADKVEPAIGSPCRPPPKWRRESKTTSVRQSKTSAKK